LSLPPPPRENFPRLEIYKRANDRRHFDKIHRSYQVAKQVRYYLEVLKGTKELKDAVLGALENMKAKRSSYIVRETVKDVRRMFKDWGYEPPDTGLTTQKEWEVTRIAASWYRKGWEKTIDYILTKALEQVGANPSPDQKSALKKRLMASLDKFQIPFYSAREADQNTFRKSEGRTIGKKKKVKPSNTASRGNGKNSIKKRWGLVGALMNGRKKKFGFGRYWNRNDEDWVTLESLHYDNCKVAFRPKLLGRTIYNLLLWGAQKEDIICQYGILLHHYHGLAVDTETLVWEPTKLVHDLRKRVFEKMGM